MSIAKRTFCLRATFAFLISPLFAHAQFTGLDFYQGIATANRFPMDSGQLQAYVSDGKMRAIRAHAWDVFQLLTEDSDIGKGIPKWETWYNESEAFAPQDSAPTRVRLRHPLEDPPELKGVGIEPPFGKGPPPKRPPRNLATFVLYNREAYDHIRTLGLYMGQQLDCLKIHGVRDIDDFPPASVALKTSWMLIPQDKCSSIPVWNFRRAIPGQPENGPGNWPPEDRVSVYPPSASCPGSNAVPVSKFYNFQIPKDVSQAQLDSIRGIDGLPGARPLDSVILVGFHFATHEIPDWLWATFWWHNLPDVGPYGEDRPDTVEPWRNYLMTVSYDMDKPREPDATPRIAYNPYLEGGLDEGLTSNCMTCHRRAAWPKQDPIKVRLSDNSRVPEDPASIVVRGREASKATYFALASPYEVLLKTSFLWSILFNARTDGPPSNGAPGPESANAACKFPFPAPVPAK